MGGIGGIWRWVITADITGASVILVIMNLVHRKNLLIRKKTSNFHLWAPEHRWKCTALLKVYAFVFICEQLCFLDLINLELKFFFSYSSNRFSWYSCLPDNFCHRYLLNPFFDDMEIFASVDIVFSFASSTVTLITRLVEPFDGFGNDWLRNMKQLNNFALTFFGFKQGNNCRTIVWHPKI